MKYTSALIVGSVVSLLVYAMVVLGLFSGVEYSFSDRLFSEKPVDPHIVIVGIDTESLTALGQWPLSRAVIAEGLQNIIEAKPRSIGIDILFADPSRLGADDDAVLEAVFKNSPIPIVLPLEALGLRIKGNSLPIAEDILHTRSEFSGTNITFGHINLIKDRDGVVRRFPHTIRGDGVNIPSFSGQIVGKSEATHIDRIVWSGVPGTVRHVSFSDAVSGSIDSTLFKDAYVFIGATATDLHDEQTTPVSAGTAMSGVEIQAQVGNMLISGYRLHDLSTPSLVLLFLFLILTPLLLFFFAQNIVRAIVISALLFVGNLIFISILFERGITIPIVHTSLAIILSSLSSFSVRYFILERERREIRGVFSKYVSKAVLDELLKNPKAVTLGGASAEVTVFFSDIRGFTTLSESLTPRELTTLLNRYLTRMTDIILEHNGVVDKYIGDAIMAFWGAPLTNHLHATDALKSSLMMLSALDSFNIESEKIGDPAINIGIGLNTGEVIVGNMGSTQRFDYTIMGDTVNLGARLEGQTKTYGVRLLVSENTIASLRKGSDTQIPYVIRELDKVTVKGKTLPVSIFEVVEEKKKTFVTSILADFEAMREAYYRGEWSRVIEYGEKILRIGEDGPTRVLLERAREFKENPPKIWTGVYELKSK